MNDAPPNNVKDSFADAAKQWLCESYQVQFRYVAKKVGNTYQIVSAMVMFHPWMKADQDSAQYNFHIQPGEFVIGQEVWPSVALVETLRVLNDALDGRIDLTKAKMALSSLRSGCAYLRTPPPNEWSNVIQMCVTAKDYEQPNVPPTLDDDLRRAGVPFDGYDDVLNWLSLKNSGHPSGIPSITVMVHPPAQIAVEDGRVAGGKLSVAVDLMPSIDVSAASVAVVGYPPLGIMRRKQVREKLEWKISPDKKRNRGTGTVDLPGGDAVLVALSIGNTYVQRQWYRDPSLSKNVRFAAAQEFDNDLKKIKERLNAKNSPSFEKAIAALMFLNGFAPLLPLEEDGPDIVAVTPGGQVVLVECTLKTTDVVAKITKLVSRREALQSAFSRGNHSNPLMVILVSQTPRSQVPMSDVDIASYNVLLMTQEDIQRQVFGIHVPVDADEMCMRGFAKLRELNGTLDSDHRH